MFELFGRYEFEVILDTKDNQNLSKQVKQQDEQCDREEQIQVASKIGFVNAEVFWLDDKTDSLSQGAKQSKHRQGIGVCSEF